MALTPWWAISEPAPKAIPLAMVLISPPPPPNTPLLCWGAARGGGIVAAGRAYDEAPLLGLELALEE